MVYTLGSVVNSVQSEFPAVRLSTLVEHLDSLIRTHARLMKDRRCGSFLWSLLLTHLKKVTPCANRRFRVRSINIKRKSRRAIPL